MDNMLLPFLIGVLVVGGLLALVLMLTKRGHIELIPRNIARAG